MTDHALTTMVSGFYDVLNQKCNFLSRVNEQDLPKDILDIIKQLSGETMKRYYGSGIVIPENIKGCRILDIGCGSGSLVFILAKLVGPEGYVVGVDISQGLIDTCKAESEYHTKAWGYQKQNFEFLCGNAERLLEYGMEPFDVIVSNGVFCLVPDKAKAFQTVAALLKPGGQFYLNDVYTMMEQPQETKENETLWSLGTAGSMVWSDLKTVAGKEGFTTPYLTQAAGVNIVNEEYRKMLSNAEYVCAAWRLFKLPKDAKRGAATVTYSGNVDFYPDSFPWDINLTFKKGEPVPVDGELATILANTNFSNYFTIDDFAGNVSTHRNQDPFKRLADLKKIGQEPEPIYKVE